MRVDRLRAAYEIDLKFVQFPLHPETPPEGLTLEELFAGRNIDIAASQEHMKQLMAKEGLPYGNRSMTYNSRLAQELAKWAEIQPGGESIHDALYRAYFVEGQNLALVETLMAVAEGVGLNAVVARRVLVKRQFRDAVDADWQRSRDLGVTGVPTFVAGNQGVVGARVYGVLEELVVPSGATLRKTH